MTRFCKKAAAVFVSMSAALSMIPAMSASADGSDWNFTYFGTSVNASYNKLVEGSYEAGTVKLQSATFKADGSINKKGGKFVADSPADGASYYYTTIDPSTQNFVLQADITLDELNPKVDGQEGFALMARDKVWDSGKGGSCMSNLVSVAGTKLPYNGSDVKDAIGVRAYTGIFTPEASEENAISPVRYAWTNKKIAQGNTYRLRLEKTDNAYITTQYDPETGDTIGSYTYYIPAKDSYATSITGYDELDDPLSYQDKDNAYIAMVVARGVNATFSNITFSTSEWNASNWTPQPTKYIDPTLTITSAATAAGGEYNLMFRTNADGAADVYCDEELLASGIEVTADTMMSYTYPMTGSEATYSVVFTPQEGYALSAYEVLSNYDEISRSINVTQNELGEGEYIYASPDGSSTNGGTSTADAVDIVTALEYAKAGQTIILESGTYTLADALTISRGRNGKSGAPITVTTSDGEFATIDFRNSGSGLNLWGNYWNISNINICNSTGKGMQIYGSHNTVERMNFWNNGNTGLQIAGSSADDKNIWPAYNNVINCTSMNNADKALEDADGFAAKLTCGAGNVFDGCIAAYNADDGWDLFAKVATGQIGAVEIKNSVTYKNGYLMVTEGSTAASFELASVTCDSLGNLSFSSGVEIEAGNGNGFKMGGSNIPGAHSLSGSTAFNNKAKGIDSNSCPDISISDSVSYNNGSYNVALYTGNASAVTAYSASGIISYRSGEYANVKENIKLQSQEEGDIYNSSNYFWSDAASSSANADGVTVSDDWFESLDTSVVPSRKADGSIDMHGLLVLKECTVTFETDGGSEIPQQSCACGKAAEKPADPQKPGYSFSFWTADDSTEYDFSAAVTTDLALTAVWAINQYTITFDTNGGSEIAPITQDFGTAITAPAEPVKPGVVFTEWSPALPETMPAGDLTVYAQWEKGNTLPALTYDSQIYTPNQNAPAVTTSTAPATADNSTVDISKLRITGVQNEGRVDLSWDTVPDATGYSMYVGVDGKYVYLCDLGTASSAQVVAAGNGKYYVSTGGNFSIFKYDKNTGKFTKTGTFKASGINTVVSVNNVTLNFMVKHTINGKKSDADNSYRISVKVYYKPAIKLTADKNSISVRWNKVPGATKYRVYKYVDGKLKLLTELSKNSLRITNTKAGKKYTFAVRALVNGEWTKVYNSDLASITA